MLHAQGCDKFRELRDSCGSQLSAVLQARQSGAEVTELRIDVSGVWMLSLSA